MPEATLAPLVIAHRGASGYLPEHTLPAKALAYGQGADFLEQDVVATRDDELVVLHDIHLDTVTDVAERFPERAREDGRWYARDFSLEELRGLKVFERSAAGEDRAVYPGRFPHRLGRFGIATLSEEVQMITGLNRASGRNVGIYPEIKKPAWHHAEGVDVAALMLEILAGLGYSKRSDNVYLQCFDPLESRRLRDELGTDLRIIQLLADNAWSESDADYSRMQTEAGLQEVAGYADGIGPWLRQLYEIAELDGHPIPTGLVERAHRVGLTVHAYTFRADELPPGFDTYAELVRWSVETAGIDGLFTDFPDITLALLDRPGRAARRPA